MLTLFRFSILFSSLSLSLTNLTLAIVICGFISDSFPIDPESVYFTRCLIKSNYKSNHAVTIRFLAFDSKGKQLNKFTEKYYPDTDWTTMRLTTGFFKTAARFGRIVVSFPSKPDKVFWLDDLESYSVYRIQK